MLTILRTCNFLIRRQISIYAKHVIIFFWHLCTRWRDNWWMWVKVPARRPTPHLPVHLSASSTQSTAAWTRYNEATKMQLHMERYFFLLNIKHSLLCLLQASQHVIMPGPFILRLKRSCWTCCLLSRKKRPPGLSCVLWALAGGCEASTSSADASRR